MGLEPISAAWKAAAQPLYHTHIWSNEWDSNPWRTRWQRAILPTELPLHMVGVEGFEPPTFWSQTRRSSQAELRPVKHILFKL